MLQRKSGPAEVKSNSDRKKKYANAIRLANQIKAGVPGCKPEDLCCTFNKWSFFFNLTWKISLEH